MQLNLVHLGTVFCDLPDSFIPLLRMSLRWPLGWLFKYVGTAYVVIKSGAFIFPNIFPRNPLRLFRLFWESIQYFTAPKVASLPTPIPNPPRGQTGHV